MLKNLITENNTALTANAQTIIEHYKDNMSSDIIVSANNDESREESRLYEMIMKNRKMRPESTSKNVTGEF